MGGTDDRYPRARVVAWVLRLGLIPLVLVALSEIVLIGFAACVALAPIAAERVLGIRMPSILHLAVATLALVEVTGRALQLYEGHPIPYDVFAHAAEVGAVAAVIVDLGIESGRLKPGGLLGAALTGAGLGVGIGLGWEVTEAVADRFLSSTLQHGLDDTLLDIAAGAFGATAVAVAMLSSRGDGDAGGG